MNLSADRGLIKREQLTDVDVGFAFLPEFWSKGYASEAASAVVEYGRDVLGVGRIVAITSLDNSGSIKVLEKLGLRFERITWLAANARRVDRDWTRLWVR